MKKDKRAKARLKALELRAKGLDLKSVAKVHATEQTSEKISEEVIETSKKLVSRGYSYIRAWKICL